MPYFDHNATTPLCPPAREAWLRVQDRLWHNASSLYREAAAARDELERCRERLAELTGTGEPDRIVFTSGATEGCNAFFRMCSEWIASHPAPRPRVVLSLYEHPAVREPARRVCQAEMIDAAAMDRLVHGPEPIAAAWMAANNETGEVFPWQRWFGPAAPGSAGRRYLCDASQWLGKLPAAAFAGTGPQIVGCAHKFGGPKGVGFVRTAGPSDESDSSAWQFGGPQEHGRRAGTEDVAGAAALVAALEWCEDQMPGDPAPRDAFEHELGWTVVAGDRPRLWNTSMVVAPRHQNKLWLARLSQRGFQCSTGSACSSGSEGDSHVLAALGLQPEERRRVLRFSSGWTTTPDDWTTLRTVLREVLHDLDRR